MPTVIPKTFSQLHQIAGWSSGDIETAWSDVNEAVARDLLTWLFEEDLLNQQQKEKLTKIVEEVTAKKEQQNLLLTLSPLLEESQAEKVGQKYGELVIEKIKGVYEQLEKRATVEQRQVMQSYLAVQH